VIEPLFTPRAEHELQTAAEWIAEDNPQAARALLRAAMRAARLLRRRPQLGSMRLRWAPARYRFRPLRGFPYPLVYYAEAATPHVVRFIHTARNLPAALGEDGGLHG
jgi:toxin ParE1/3/4